MRQHIDESAVQEALTLAQRAPSIHNTQPWAWRMSGCSFHLYADRDRHLPVADPDGRDLLISCGAALHHLRAALASVGWSGEVRRLPDPTSPDRLATIGLRRHERTAGDLALAIAIRERRTELGRYSSWPVPAGMIARLVDEAANEGVELRLASGAVRAALFAAMHRAERRRAEDPAYAAELAHWTGTRDCPVPVGSGPDDASVLLVAGTVSDGPMSWLRAGEATSAVLLAATEYRLASAPLTQALRIADTRELVGRELMQNRLVPQVVVRVGFPPFDVTPTPYTPRRPVADTVRRLE